MVTRRTANAKAPVVAVLINVNGHPVARPISRETDLPDRAITGTVAEKSVMVRFTVDQLYA